MDVPIYIQYARWLGIAPYPEKGFEGVFQGSLGASLWSRVPVIEELKNRLPVSLELGVMAIVLGLILAIPTGIYSAIRQDTIGDYTMRSISILAISIPSFWLGTMVIVYPSIWWGWTPSMEYLAFNVDPIGNLKQFVLPAIILSAVLLGTTMRMTRTMVLEVLRQDYIRTAWSKGLKEGIIVVRHVLKNAMIPVITIIGLLLPITISGSVVLENMFNLPGIGQLLVKATTTRDYPIISGINFVLAFFVLFINLLIDLTYSWLDPRIIYK